MIVCLNGRFVPEDRAVVSVLDRGFLYGDGLFESLRVSNGRPFRWDQHMDRLRQGAGYLGIRIPFSAVSLRQMADRLISRNRMPESILRLTLSRGIGSRGYSPAGAGRPTLVMTLCSAPAGTSGRVPVRRGPDARQRVPPPRWRLVTASTRLPAGEPLSRFKTCNKLSQVVARAEADAAGADEALLLNTDGFVVEGSSSNVFWIERDSVCTPPPGAGVLPGVTRAVVLEICRSRGLRTRESSLTLAKLKRRQGVFLTLSSRGIVEARSLDGRALSSSVLVRDLRLAYWKLVQAETAK
jgi:branched-chain amino acid aminotransferase